MLYISQVFKNLNVSYSSIIVVTDFRQNVHFRLINRISDYKIQHAFHIHFQNTDSKKCKFQPFKFQTYILNMNIAMFILLIYLFTTPKSEKNPL